jgi:hypothetical protein
MMSFRFCVHAYIYHAQARCTWYSIMWSSSSVTCGMSTILRALQFPAPITLTTTRPQYNWDVVESGIKHHNTNPIIYVRSGERYRLLWASGLAKIVITVFVLLVLHFWMLFKNEYCTTKTWIDIFSHNI